MIVVDASVLANALGDDGRDGERARARLRAEDGASGPDLLDVETLAVLRKRWLAGTITARRFAAAVTDLIDLDLERYPTHPLLHRVFELRSNVTAYDAAYVALAEVLDVGLLTADGRLSRAAGVRCEIEVLRATPV